MKTGIYGKVTSNVLLSMKEKRYW